MDGLEDEFPFGGGYVSFREGIVPLLFMDVL